MEKFKLNYPDEQVSPDFVRIDELGFKTDWQDDDAIPIIFTHRFDNYGIGTLFVGGYSESHDDLFQYMGLSVIKDSFETFADEDLCLRVWLSNNILTSWGYDENIKEKLKEINYYFHNSVDYFYKVDDEVKHIHNPSISSFYINFGELDYFWEGYEEDEFGMEINYAYCETVDNLISSDIEINKADDTQQREFHLMTPDEKAEYLKNNDEKRQERINYFKEGEKAWVNKRGDVDPAYYHLTMYGENTMKIGEKDIRRMVNECLKKLINENMDNISPLAYFDSCIEKLQRLEARLETIKQVLPGFVEELQGDLLRRYYVKLSVNGYRMDDTGIILTVSTDVINKEDIDVEDVDINNPEDIQYYIEDSIDKAYYEIKSWSRNKLYFIDAVSLHRNELYIEMDEFNPMSIESKLPDV